MQLKTLLLSLPQNLMHLLAFGEFVDEFVEVADLLHKGVLDVLDADAADGAGDEGGVGVPLRGLFVKVAHGRAFLDLFREARPGITRQPADDLV